MPQGAPYLHEFWKYDGNAWEHLSPNFHNHHFLITRKRADYTPTFVDLRAIEYLCDEWDWSYEPGPMFEITEEDQRDTDAWRQER